MKTLFFLIALISAQASFSETIYQCAVDKVVPDGVRVNVIESQGQVRANLLSGTTVSGLMYSVSQTVLGFEGSIKGRPTFPIQIYISTQRAKNSNIEGFRSHVKAIYPSVLNSKGYDSVDTDLICGKKISDRWQ